METPERDCVRMTPEQALNLLYGLCRLAPVNADIHEQARQAVIVLMGVLKPKTEEKQDATA